MRASAFIDAVLAIAGKDLAIEWRTKTAFASSLVFAILVLSILFVARDASVVSALDAAPGALWVTFTFAAMVGMNRAFLLERENRALEGLLLTPVPPAGIFVGKVVANLAFVAAIELLAIPLFIVFYDVPLWQRLPELLAVMALATFAFVPVGTLLGAMVVRTRFAELMGPLLLLPFLVPPIIGAVQVTAGILSGRPLSAYTGWLSLLGLFDLVFVTVSILLFDAILDR